MLESDNFYGIDIGRRSFPTLVDLDRDGDLDLIVGSGGGQLAFFRNDGTRGVASFVPDSSFTLTADGYSTPAFADIDADGDIDLFVGGIGGGLLFYENRRVAR